MPAARLYVEVVQPAMYEVGVRWEQARISVAQEHLATQITQGALAELALRLGAGTATGTGRTALVCCSPGELHALGGQMVADFLEADGWRILPVGPDASADGVADLARERAADLVALSTALSVNLQQAGLVCAALRRLPEPPFIVAGGQAFRGDADRAPRGGRRRLRGGPRGASRAAR